MLAPYPRTKGSQAKRLKLVASPTAEPIGITLEEAALKLNINQNAFQIQNRIRAARSLIEQKINRKLIQQTYDLFLDDEAHVGNDSGYVPWRWSQGYTENCGMPEIQLPFPPCQSVLGIYTTDDTGLETLCDPSVYYVTQNKEPMRVRLNAGQQWPIHRGGESFRIRFTCGYATPITISQDTTGTILAQNHGYNSGDTVTFYSQDGTLPSPLFVGQNYIVTNLSSTGFQVTDISGNLLTPDQTWTGVAFLGEVPAPLLEAMVMVSALNQGGEVPSRLPGVSSRLSPIELPIDASELISPFYWPTL